MKGKDLEKATTDDAASKSNGGVKGLLKRRVGRRTFLKGAAGASLALVGGGILAACVPEATPTPAPTATPVPAEPTPTPPPAVTVAPTPTTPPAPTATPPPAPTATPSAPTVVKFFLAAHTPFYNMVKGDFEKQFNAKVEVTTEQFGLIPSKLGPFFASGAESFDVVYLWRAWLEQYKDHLIPLDALGWKPDPAWEADLMPAGKEAAIACDGRYYGLPSNTYTYTLFCNKKMFADAGMKVPTTYAEFLEAAKFFTKGDQFGYTDGWAPLYLLPKFDVWLHLNGGSLYAQDGAVTINTPEAAAAVSDMMELYQYMPPESISSPWGIYDVEAKKVFFGGKAAMIIDYGHIWYESANPTLSVLGEDPVEVAIVPGKGGNLPKSAGQFVGECFAIPVQARRKELALELIKYYSNPKTMLGLLTMRDELIKFDPAGEDGFPPFKSPYEDPSVRDLPIVKVTFEQQKYKGYRYGTRPAYQKITDIIEGAVSAALNKQKSVADTLKEAQEACDVAVDEEKKTNPDFKFCGPYPS